MIKVIETTTPTCTVCKMLKPMIEKVMGENSDVEFEELNGLEGKGAELVEKYHVKAVPTFFFFKDEQLVETHVGSITPIQLKNKLNNLR